MMTTWYVILEENAFAVELKPDTPVETFKGFPPIAYRSANITRPDGANVRVYSGPGQPSTTDGPLAGKCVLYVQYFAWPNTRATVNAQLADDIQRVLIAAGMRSCFRVGNRPL